MQLPLLSTLLGPSGPRVPLPPGGEASEAFALLLASVPAQEASNSPQIAVTTAVQPAALPPVAALAELQTLPPEPGTAPLLPASLQTASPAHPGKSAAPGKAAPQPGKFLPLLPPAAGSPLIETLPKPPPGEPFANSEKAGQEPTPLAFAEPAPLQNWAPQPDAVAPPPAKLAVSAPMPGHMMAPAAALNLPLTRPPTKDHAKQTGDTPSPLTPTEPAQIRPAPAIVASIPLTRPQTGRRPLAPEFAPAPVLQPALPPPEPLGTSPDPATNIAPAEQSAMPEAELGTVIDKLVETRIHSREGRSEINVPHPDFGRVTLALSLAGQDRLSIAMPDAPAELRAAVGQAFAPPPRTETAAPAPAADTAFTGGNDPRGQDPRRDPQSHSGRSDQARPNTYAEQNRQFTTKRDNRHEASGRGVLA